MEKLTVYIIIGVAWAVITVLRNLQKQKKQQRDIISQNKPQESVRTAKGNKVNTPPPPPMQKIGTQNQQSEGREELKELLKKISERRSLESSPTVDNVIINEIVTTGKEHTHTFHSYNTKKELKSYEKVPDESMTKLNRRDRPHPLRTLFQNGTAIRNAMVMNLVLNNPHQDRD